MSWFNAFSTGCARFAGRPAMLLIAMGLSLVGVIAFLSGSDHFLGGASLAISTVTLLLLPILQATQNREGAALQAKIDELLLVHKKARNSLIGVEQRSSEEIEQVRNSEGRMVVQERHDRRDG